MRHEIIFEVTFYDPDEAHARAMADTFGDYMAQLVFASADQGVIDDPTITSTIDSLDDGTINDETGAEP